MRPGRNAWLILRDWYKLKKQEIRGAIKLSQVDYFDILFANCPNWHTIYANVDSEKTTEEFTALRKL